MSEAGARTDMTLVDFFGGQNPEEEEDRDGFYVNRKELFSRGTSTYDICKILEFFNPSPSFCPQNLYRGLLYKMFRLNGLSVYFRETE